MQGRQHAAGVEATEVPCSLLLEFVACRRNLVRVPPLLAHLLQRKGHACGHRAHHKHLLGHASQAAAAAGEATMVCRAVSELKDAPAAPEA